MSRRILHFALPLLGAALLLAPACDRAPQAEATLEQVAEAPRELAGDVVTIEGRVHRVLGECAFELEDSELLFPDRVLTLCQPKGPAQEPPSAPAEVAEGDWLRVTGVAGEMTRENYEFKTTLTLDDDVFGERETRPVIFIQMAQEIEPPTPEDGEARLPETPVVVPML